MFLDPYEKSVLLRRSRTKHVPDHLTDRRMFRNLSEKYVVINRNLPAKYVITPTNLQKAIQALVGPSEPQPSSQGKYLGNELVKPPKSRASLTYMLVGTWPLQPIHWPFQSAILSPLQYKILLSYDIYLEKYFK